jgi:ribosomal protein L11 methylase PrmA
MRPLTKHPASYRDPSGYIFEQDGQPYRFVHTSYQPHYDQFVRSGLYQKLAGAGLIIPHTDATALFDTDTGCYKILQPEPVPFWTYPYEWSFEQLRQAALLTLKLNLAALEHGMILKDASAYNIQFRNGKALLTDTLSFELYEEGKPWQAFRQFCQHFLYPLLLHSRLHHFDPAMLMHYTDGVPAAVTASILPGTARFNANLWLYLYLPAKLAAQQQPAQKQLSIPKTKIVQNMQHLSSVISKLRHKTARSQWNHYYTETILSNQYLEHKEILVTEILAGIQPRTTVDIGCNTGAFSKIAAQYSNQVISLDTDPLCIDIVLQETQKTGLTNITPLVADISNPSPATGWNNKEHKALLERLSGDCVLALALIHHIALSKNVPLDFIVQLFAQITSQYLVIEFVPKTDPRAQLLLQSREDIFNRYTQQDFEKLLQQHFTILRSERINDSERTLYLLSVKNPA